MTLPLEMSVAFQDQFSSQEPFRDFAMETSAESYARKKRELEPKNLTRTFTTRGVTEDLSGVLLAFPAKHIANATGSSVRAAENARQGLNAMSLAHFLNACRAIPELRAWALEAMGCEGETDPEFHRALHHLVNAYQRRKVE